MDNKEEILANFQAITGESDIGKSLCILESCNWDLETAVTSFVSDNITTTDNVSTNHFSASTSNETNNHILSFTQSDNNVDIQSNNPSSSDFLSSIQQFSNNSNNVTSQWTSGELSSRILTFYVQYHDMVFTLQFSESETIGKFKELLSFTVGENLQSEDINIIQGTLSNCPSSLILRELELPLENTLMIEINKKELIVGETLLDPHIPTIHDSRSLNESSEFLDLAGQSGNFSASGSTVALDLNQSVKSNLEEKSKIEIHKRHVSSGRSASSLGVQASDSEELYSSQLEEDDLSFTNEEPQSNKRQKLMDPNMEGVQQSIQQFCSVFFSRYLDGDPKNGVFGASIPPFHVETLAEAAQSTLFATPSLRKPLFLYLHKDDCLTSHIFPLKVLCHEKFCNFLSTYELALWPWDLTCTVNRTRFITTLVNTFDHHISQQIASIASSRFPLLILLLKVQSRIELALIIDGEQLEMDAILQQLGNVMEDYQNRLSILIQEEMEMRQRELIREEQDKAYEETKRLDELLEEKKRKEREAVELEKAQQVAKEEEKAMEKQSRMNEAQALVPAEPDVTVYSKTDLAHLRIRLSDESGVRTVSRYFHADNSLLHLILFLESLGFLREDYKMLTTFPRRDLSSVENKDTTLRELKLVPQETITLEKL